MEVFYRATQSDQFIEGTMVGHSDVSHQKPGECYLTDQFNRFPIGPDQGQTLQVWDGWNRK